MIRPPPRSTLTEPLLPSPTLFRSLLQHPPQLRQKLQKRNLVRSPERAARRRKSKLNRREPRRPPVLAALVVRFPFSTTREPRKAQMLRRLSPAWRTDSLKHPLSKGRPTGRSEEHTSELQSLMRISYAVFCLKKKNT